MFAIIDIFDVDITLKDMNAAAIKTAWAHPSDHADYIDGAFIWGGTMAHIIANGGYMLMSAGQLGNWGVFNNTPMLRRVKGTAKPQSLCYSR